MDWAELGRIVQPWAAVGGMALAATSLFIASRSLQLASRTNKAKFVFDLTDQFLKEPSLKAFWYRIDYDRGDKAWRFDLGTFRHSEEERLLDVLIYKFQVIGHMLRSGAVDPRDMSGLYTTCRQLFHNANVRDYVRFVQIDFYCADGFTHLQFENALYCYQQLTRDAVRRGHIDRSELRDCKAFIAELRSISKRADLREQIARRIGYTLYGPPPKRRWLLLPRIRRAAGKAGNAVSAASSAPDNA